MTNLIERVISLLKDGKTVTLLDPHEYSIYKKHIIVPFDEHNEFYYWGGGTIGVCYTIEQIEEDLKKYSSLIMIDN